MICVNIIDYLAKKIFFLCLILFVISNDICSAFVPNISDSEAFASEMPGSNVSGSDTAQDPSPHLFVMMSDGKKSRAIPVEEFLNVAFKDAAHKKDVMQKRGNKDLQDVLGAKQNLEKESFQDLINSALKNSFIVDTLKESAKESGNVIKSIAKSVIKGLAVGVTMGVVLLIGGAIVWQVLIVPAYCKGPGPVIASWLPISDYWQPGEHGICKNYASQENSILTKEAELRRAAQAISKNVTNVILPDGSINKKIPGYCKIENGEIVWCDPSLCDIDNNIRGCQLAGLKTVIVSG